MPFGSFSIVIASSKSRACSPSIVTVGDVAEVGAAADVRSLRPRRRAAIASAIASARVRVGDAVLADDDLGVDAGRVDVAEHLDDAADRRRASAVGQRVSSTITISPGVGAAFLPGGIEDVHQHAAIERHDVAHAVSSRS